MIKFLQNGGALTVRKYGHVVLALCCVLGFLSGVYFRNIIEIPVMPVIFFDHLSIVDLWLSALIPLFFFAFAVYTSQPLLLYIFSFLKAFTISFAFLSISIFYEEVGWLFAFLFCFHSVALLTVIFWYALRNVSYNFFINWVELFLVAAICIVFVLIEYYFIVPLARDLFDFLKG